MSAIPTTYTFETVSIDANGEIVDRHPGKVEGLKQSLGGGIELDLVSIPGGTFMMGDERHHQDEQPVHRVKLPAFYMSRYPITQAQYRVLMGEGAGFGIGENCPIEKINCYEAMEFCQKLTALTGNRYTLPSEAQWEYAARAGTTTPFYFGDIITPDLVNYNGEFPYNGAPVGENRDRSTPVGSFPANNFGLFDMHGNVWEWCLDSYQPSYNGAPADGSAWIDDSLPERELKRVMRGGAWDYVARGCRSAVRCSLASDRRLAGCGMRVVLQR